MKFKSRPNISLLQMILTEDLPLLLAAIFPSKSFSIYNGVAYFSSFLQLLSRALTPYFLDHVSKEMKDKDNT